MISVYDEEFGIVTGGPNCEHPSTTGGVCDACGLMPGQPAPPPEATTVYDDGRVVIVHGDALGVLAHAMPAMLAEGVPLVFVTDPPYGIAYETSMHRGVSYPTGIEGDADTTARDAVLDGWPDVPAIVFGSPKAAPPADVNATLVWSKPGSGMGDLALPWKPDWELIFVRGRGWEAPNGRESAVLTFPLRVYRGDLVHPHEKPIELMRKLIAYTPPMAVIIDPFMGSGTTIRAAKDLGRRALGIDIEERYCAHAVQRLGQEVLFT